MLDQPRVHIGQGRRVLPAHAAAAGMRRGFAMTCDFLSPSLIMTGSGFSTRTLFSRVATLSTASTSTRRVACPHDRTSSASLTKPFKSRGVPEREHDYPAKGRTALALGFLLADARQRGAGVNVERPQPKARTNDVDAGDEWRRIDQEPWCTFSLLGAGDTGVTITSDQRLVGQAGIGCRASLRAAEAHGALRPQPDRLESQGRPRHRGGGPAELRARALAVPDLPHAASALVRQRISPSRRPK